MIYVHCQWTVSLMQSETIELHNLHLRRIPQFDNDEGARLLRRQLLEFKDLRNRFDATEPKEKRINNRERCADTLSLRGAKESGGA